MIEVHLLSYKACCLFFILGIELINKINLKSLN